MCLSMDRLPFHIDPQCDASNTSVLHIKQSLALLPLSLGSIIIIINVVKITLLIA